MDNGHEESKGRHAMRVLEKQLWGTSNNDVFFVGLIAGAARR
jgi:hypothetical protein